MMDWRRQTRNVMPPMSRNDAVTRFTLRPWCSTHWSLWAWAATTRVVTRFLNQRSPQSEALFCRSLGDLAEMTSRFVWLLELLVVILYAVYEAGGIYNVLFRSWARNIEGTLKEHWRYTQRTMKEQGAIVGISCIGYPWTGDRDLEVVKFKNLITFYLSL